MARVSGASANGGLFPDRDEAWMTFTNAQTRGDILYVQSSTVDSTTGEMNTVISCPAAPTTIADNGLFVVCLDSAVAAGKRGRCLLRGKAPVLTFGNIAVGDNLAVVSGKAYVDQAVAAGGSATGSKIIAKPLTTATGPGTNIIPCYFDGWGGFGRVPTVDT